ncbi:MAG: hypothetical protein GPOALKHO_000720 [Sodalis sp.]|nr:MAG: hypothetical protein GPOALKHO_000720 [Sodalis sp.]
MIHIRLMLLIIITELSMIELRSLTCHRDREENALHRFSVSNTWLTENRAGKRYAAWPIIIR